MIEAQVTARDIRRRLMNPPNGRRSSELEIVSEAKLRQQRADLAKLRAAERLERKIQEQAREIQKAQEKLEASRQAAMIAATPEGEVIPVIPKFSAIMGTVCKRYDVTQIDLVSSRRTKDVVLPRQVLMYLARHLTAMSLPQIASRLGGRDHTTAISGVNKIKRLIAEDARLSADIDNIKWELGIR
jgi:chromosomal replication initiator protein